MIADSNTPEVTVYTINRRKISGRNGDPLMRMMLRFHFPVDPGNELIRSGKVGKVFEQLGEDLKPEVMYLYPEAGERGGIVVFDMSDISEVAGVVERFSFGLSAKVELIPVMSPEDLQRGLASIPDILERYD